MIRFERVTQGPVRNLSFDLDGGTTKILCDSDERKNILFGLLAGRRRPESGRIFFFGEDLFARAEDERLALFRRVGVVPADGGLISNLKAWENLLLPAWYHRGLTAEQAERPVSELLEQIEADGTGLKRCMGELPGQLSLYERRVVALARAMLLEPDVLIYDFIFAGLERDAAQRLMKLTGEFHGKKAGRISLYLCPDDALSARLPADRSITLTQ